MARLAANRRLRWIAAALLAGCFYAAAVPTPPPIRFSLASIAFRLENDETPFRHAPAAMAGGVAIFDYNGDGRPDIFFTNGAKIDTLTKDDPKYRNRLFRNDGNGVFTDVTAQAGVAGAGYDIGAAAGDYDNDGHPDLFVAGVHRNTLYHNNGDGTFTDVTARAGLNRPDPRFGPPWAVAGAWVDVDNDGLLDLFIVNYVQWDFATEPKCLHGGQSEYCNPSHYRAVPNQLFLNKGNGTFEDVSERWGLRAHPGKGMGAAVADFDGDGRPDIFVTNDTYYNFFFHNLGSKFEEIAFQTNTALVEDGNFISGMGLDFRDLDNDGLSRHRLCRARQANVSDAQEYRRPGVSGHHGGGRNSRTVNAHGRLRRGHRRLRQRRLEGSVRHARRCRLAPVAWRHRRSKQHRVPQSRRQRQMASFHG